MKKLIAILVVMIVLVGAVFADDVSKQLTITTTVRETKPAFTLYGNTSNSTSGRQGADATFTFANDAITTGSLTLYCWIAQTNDSRWSGNVVITVAASALSNTTAVGSNAAGTYSVASQISNITAMNPITKHTAGDVRKSVINDTNHTVTATYGTGHKAAAGDIASFSVTWAQSEDLPPATYSATITTTYTAP